MTERDLSTILTSLEPGSKGQTARTLAECLRVAKEPVFVGWPSSSSCGSRSVHRGSCLPWGSASWSGSPRPRERSGDQYPPARAPATARCESRSRVLAFQRPGKCFGSAPERMRRCPISHATLRRYKRLSFSAKLSERPFILFVRRQSSCACIAEATVDASSSSAEARYQATLYHLCV